MADDNILTPPAAGATPPPAGTPPSPPPPTEHPFPADIQVSDAIKTKFKTVNALATAYENLEKAFGQKAASAIPATDAPADQWDAFYTKIGRPAKPEEYEIPQGLGKPTDPLVKDVLAAGFKSGLTKTQMNSVFSAYLRASSEVIAQNEKQQADAALNNKMSLIKDPDFGKDYEGNIAHTTKFIKAQFGDELISEVGKSPALVKAFYKMARNWSGDDNVAVSRFSQSPADIDVLLKDTKSPYYDRKHPLHEDAKASVEKYFKTKNGVA